MKKNISRIFAVALLSFGSIYSMGIFAKVSVHGTVNNVTFVTCTGGCSISSGGWGTVNVCDQGGTCIRLFGQVREGIPRELEEPVD